MKLFRFGILEMEDKHLTTDLLLVFNELNKKDIVDIYPIGKATLSSTVKKTNIQNNE